MFAITFDRLQHIINEIWEETTEVRMKTVIQEGAQHAEAIRSLDKHGILLLTVVTDGAWAKRFYRTIYNSLSS